MPNRWIEFVKEFASKNNLTYGCAVSTPACKEEYRKKYGVGKKVSQKKEREQMGEEEVRGKKVRSAEAEERKRLVEMSRMMGEDVKPARPTDLMVQALREAGKDPSAYLEMLKKRTLVVPPAVRATPIQYKPKAITEVPPKPKRKLIIEEEEPEQNITMEIAEVAPAKRSRGRPKKYATAEEAKKAKYAQTTASKKKTAEMRKKLLEEAREKLREKKESEGMEAEDVNVAKKKSISIIKLFKTKGLEEIAQHLKRNSKNIKIKEARELAKEVVDVVDDDDDVENAFRKLFWKRNWISGKSGVSFGFGYNKFKNILKDNGYSIEDKPNPVSPPKIKKGGVLMRGGAVGTPYINQGTNPRGVIGGSKREELVKQVEKLQREMLGDRFEPIAFTNVPPPPEDLVRPVIRRPAVRRGREEEEETPEEALSRMRERQQAINQRQTGRGRKYGGVAPPRGRSNYIQMVRDLEEVMATIAVPFLEGRWSYQEVENEMTDWEQMFQSFFRDYPQSASPQEQQNVFNHISNYLRSLRLRS